MDLLIASDIDGTLTDNTHGIPSTVLEYLEKLNNQGVDLLFVTGRPFFRGHSPLEKIPFPYHLAVYNGSLIFKMPDKEVIFRDYLDSGVLEHVAQVCEGSPTDVVIYGGYEHQDLCYFRPHLFEKELLNFLQQRCAFHQETWIPVESFDDVPIRIFPSVKCFGKRDSLLEIKREVEKRLELYAPVISDSTHPEYCIAQITKRGVDKGKTIENLKALHPHKNYKTIACGDDFNDLEMLLHADIAVVMATAPKELLSIADIIAPPSTQNGIIEGLSNALQLLGKS